MAKSFRRGKVWYIRYKDENNQWQSKSCGKKATRADADYLANQYSAKELNRHHKAPVRLIKLEVEQALIKFRDEQLLKAENGGEKQESSINREKAAVNNFLEYVNDNYIKKFETVEEIVILDFIKKRKNDGLSNRTIREEIRLLKKAASTVCVGTHNI